MTFTTDQLRNTIQRGDCIEVMRRMPSRSVDFILTDPPYLVRYKDRTGRTIANDDNADVGALHGWRRELFGDAALSLKHGRLALAIEKGRVVRVDRSKD